TSTAAPNRNTPVFDWYLMPEAYSAPLIYETIDELMPRQGGTVLDPFCGTGTTLLASRLVGQNSLGIEVNPFLCFSSQVKNRPDFDLPLLKLEVERLLYAGRAQVGQKEMRDLLPPYDLPDMPRLERWMTRHEALKVLALKRCIDECVSQNNRE